MRRLPDLAGLPTAIAVAALAAVAIVGLRPVVAAAFACVCALAAMIDQRAQRLRRARAAASAATPTTRVGDDWAATVAQSFGIRVYGGIQSGLVFGHTRSNGDFTGLLGGQPPCNVDIEQFWMSRIHPDDLAGYLAELGLERMKPGVPLELEYRVIGLDGLTRHVFERLFPRERYANGDVRVEGLVLDVSDQVRAREAIAATGRRAHEIARSVGAYIYEGRLHPDGRWETTFNAVPDGDRLGLAPTLEGFEDSWRGRVLPSDLDDHDRTFNYEAARPGRPLHCEYRMRDRDGGERVLVDHLFPQPPQPDGVIVAEGIAFDVTEQRAAQRQLGAVIESAAMRIYDGVLYPDRRVEIATIDGLLPSLGHDQSHTGATHELWLELIHPADRATYAERLGYAAATAGQPLSVEYRVRDAQGRSATVLERLFPRDQREDGGIRIDGIVLDVSELRAVERRLQNTLESLDVQIYSGEVDGTDTWRMHSQAGADDRHWLGAGTAWVDEDAWRAHIEPADRAAYDALLERVKNERKASAAEYRIRRDDGSVLHVLNQLLPGEALPDGGMLVEGIVVDVTDRIEARDQLANLERRLAQVLGAVDVLVATLEVLPEGGVREHFRGPGIERLLGGRVPEGADPWQVWLAHVHEDDQALRPKMRDAIRDGASAGIQFRVVGLDGKTRWISMLASPRPTAPGENAVADVMLSDVTNREEAAEALAQARDEAERQLRVDSLTGVANRVHLIEQLDAGFAAGPDLAVVILDLDHFKRINDAFLHSSGDAVLRETAHRLAAAARPGDIVGRWSGEEFVVLLRGKPRRDELHRIAERLRSSISAHPFLVADHELRVTASAGAVVADPGMSVAQLLDVADRALYAAKRAGRDQLRIGDEIDERELLAHDPDVVRLAEALSLAATTRDGESELHCNLVAKLAGDVARELGLDAATHLRCRLVGLVHDIGKVAVPDSILAKPGKLSAAEWEVVEQHAAFGAEIVTRMPGLADAAPGVHHHHEHFDGTGYPDRLAGEAIPIEARIVAAVDAWSAMAEHRVYRAALPAHEVVAELRRASGSQFDPNVVEALCRILAREDSTTAILAA